VLAFGGCKKDGRQRSFAFQGLVVSSLHVKMCTCILRKDKASLCRTLA